MTTFAREPASTLQTGRSRLSRMFKRGARWPIWLGCALSLLFGHAPLQAQVVATLPNILIEPGDRINAVVVQPDGKVIIGGRFTEVGPAVGGGFERKLFLARLDTFGRLDPNFTPSTDGEVFTLILDGTALYVGGSFATISDITLQHPVRNLARIDSATSSDPRVASWAVDTDGPVKALAVDETRIYLGGSFNNCGPASSQQPQEYFCLADKQTGGVFTNWNLNDLDLDGEVEALAVEGSFVYLGGRFNTINDPASSGNPITRNHLAKFFLAGGGILHDWNPNANDVVYDMVLDSSSLILGGEFTSIGVSPTSRNRLARVDTSVGAVDSWDPDANSAVHTITLDGTDVYVGGDFTSIGGQSRNYAARVDGSTGSPDGWDPSPNGRVAALAPAEFLSFGRRSVYIGGDFDTINEGGPAPFNRVNIARVGFESEPGDTGQADTSFIADATVLMEISALVRAGDGSLYLGGSFFQAGGESISNLLRVTPSGVLDSSWTPNPSTAVRALALDGGNLYVGGEFTSIGGQVRSRIARIDTATGLADGWDPDANDSVFALAVNGQDVYAGGVFTAIGGQLVANRIARLNSLADNNSADSWNPNANGSVNALALDGTVVYVGGDFTDIGGQGRNGIARLDTLTDTNQADGWNPDATGGSVYALTLDGTDLYAGGSFTSIGGQARNRIARLDTLTDTNQAESWNPDATGSSVFALALDGMDHLYVGGGFTSIGGQNRNNIARLDTLTDINQADGWDPGVNGSVSALTIGCEGVVYAGGNFSQVGTETRTGLAKIGDTVTQVNCPLAVDDSATVAEGGSVQIDVLANDSDPDGTIDATTVTIVTQPANGTTSVNPATGQVTYTHDGSPTLSDSFTYTVDDNQAATSNVATVSITVIQVTSSPVANDDSATVAEGDSVVINVLANDIDVDSAIDATTVTIVMQPANGTTSVNTTTGQVTYTHDGSETVSDSFTYTVKDVNPGWTSNVALVSITVTPVNDPPVAADDSATVTEGGSVPIDVLANDTDVDSTIEARSVTIVTQPANGTTSVDVKTPGVVTYTHDGSPTLSDSFTYTVDDNQAATSNVATVSITVTPVTSPPVANDDSATVAEGDSVVINVLANDIDVDSAIDATTVTIVIQPANGMTSVNTTTGQVTYTHDGSETVSDSFTYTVKDVDPGWTSNIATVMITVNAVNDAPVAVDDSYATDVDTQLVVAAPGVLGNDTDAESDPLTAVLTTTPNGSLALAADGSFTYDPDPGFNDVDSFTYFANDSTENSASPATVTITVDPCGTGYDTLAGQWNQISLPCVPSFNTAGDILGDALGNANYGTTWLMYEWNPDPQPPPKPPGTTC
jgi:hypothetical protein